MNWRRWWQRLTGDGHDRPDAAAAADQQAKLARARAETPAIRAAAAEQARAVSPEEFAARVRLAMTLRPDGQPR